MGRAGTLTPPAIRPPGVKSRPPARGLEAGPSPQPAKASLRVRGSAETTERKRQQRNASPSAPRTGKDEAADAIAAIEARQARLYGGARPPPGPSAPQAQPGGAGRRRRRSSLGVDFAGAPHGAMANFAASGTSWGGAGAGTTDTTNTSDAGSGSDTEDAPALLQSPAARRGKRSGATSLKLPPTGLAAAPYSTTAAAAKDPPKNWSPRSTRSMPGPSPRRSLLDGGDAEGDPGGADDATAARRPRSIDTSARPRSGMEGGPISPGSVRSVRSRNSARSKSRGSVRSATTPGGVPSGASPHARDDISYRRDGLTASDAAGTAYSIPPSRIPITQRIVEASALPSGDNPAAPAAAGGGGGGGDADAAESWYDADAGQWKTVVFPARRPGGRRDVQYLEAWLTEQLAAAHAASVDAALAPKAAAASKKADGADADAKPAGGEMAQGPPPAAAARAAAMRAQMQVLMIGFHEVVRQVSVSCAERGQLLNRIWFALSDLFEEVVGEMNATIKKCELRVRSHTARTSAYAAQIRTINARHAREIEEQAVLLSHRWGKRLRAYREALIAREAEDAAGHGRKASGANLDASGLRDDNDDDDGEKNSALHADVAVWFPNFEAYAGSVHTKLLPAPAAPPDRGWATPDAALASDLQRLYGAGFGKRETDDSGSLSAGMSGSATPVAIDGASRPRDTLALVDGAAKAVYEATTLAGAAVAAAVGRGATTPGGGTVSPLTCPGTAGGGATPGGGTTPGGNGKLAGIPQKKFVSILNEMEATASRRVADAMADTEDAEERLEHERALHAAREQVLRARCAALTSMVESAVLGPSSGMAVQHAGTGRLSALLEGHSLVRLPLWSLGRVQRECIRLARSKLLADRALVRDADALTRRGLLSGGLGQRTTFGRHTILEHYQRHRVPEVASTRLRELAHSLQVWCPVDHDAATSARAHNTLSAAGSPRHGDPPGGGRLGSMRRGVTVRHLQARIEAPRQLSRAEGAQMMQFAGLLGAHDTHALSPREEALWLSLFAKLSTHVFTANHGNPTASRSGDEPPLPVSLAPMADAIRVVRDLAGVGDAEGGHSSGGHGEIGGIDTSHAAAYTVVAPLADVAADAEPDVVVERSGSSAPALACGFTHFTLSAAQVKSITNKLVLESVAHGGDRADVFTVIGLCLEGMRARDETLTELLATVWDLAQPPDGQPLAFFRFRMMLQVVDADLPMTIVQAVYDALLHRNAGTGDMQEAFAIACIEFPLPCARLSAALRASDDALAGEVAELERELGPKAAGLLARFAPPKKNVSYSASQSAGNTENELVRELEFLRERLAQLDAFNSNHTAKGSGHRNRPTLQRQYICLQLLQLQTGMLEAQTDPTSLGNLGFQIMHEMAGQHYSHLLLQRVLGAWKKHTWQGRVQSWDVKTLEKRVSMTLGMDESSFDNPYAHNEPEKPAQAPGRGRSRTQTSSFDRSKRERSATASFDRKRPGSGASSTSSGGGGGGRRSFTGTPSVRENRRSFTGALEAQKDSLTLKESRRRQRRSFDGAKPSDFDRATPASDGAKPSASALDGAKPSGVPAKPAAKAGSDAAAAAVAARRRPMRRSYNMAGSFGAEDGRVTEAIAAARRTIGVPVGNKEGGGGGGGGLDGILAAKSAEPRAGEKS